MIAWSTATLAVAAIVQAVSAAFVAWLTRRLVRATNKYAETAEKLLKVNQEQFERDWRPDLRIADIQRIGSTQVFLRLANLAKPAALVKELKIGTGGRSPRNHPPQDIERYPLIYLVPGGQVCEQVWIQLELGRYRQKYNPPPAPSNRSQWQVSMSIAVVYDCAGRENQTTWLDCVVSYEDQTVTNVGRLE